ncbi:hypothetical protein CDAR_267581 [Caerostris darwini]|uniref:Transmembrane protein n=1 Tax=Caerostris darwini TaxID=1538125 RepID=A0AAV4TI14_9ARAC|nr:hypothetical protein CDAR_267581 [Caerostris darwini]
MGRQPFQGLSCAKRVSGSTQSSPCSFLLHVVMDGATPGFDFSGRLPPSLCSCLRGCSPHLLLFRGKKGAAVLFPSFFPFLFFRIFFLFPVFRLERGMELDGFQRTGAATDIQQKRNSCPWNIFIYSET